MGFDDLSNMPIAAISAYLERLPARQAEFKLALADAASVPHMDKNAMRSTMREWERVASGTMENAEVVSPVRLKMLGIGVRYVQ